MKIATTTEVKVTLELTQREAEYLKAIIQNTVTGNAKADEFISTLWAQLTQAGITLP